MAGLVDFTNQEEIDEYLKNTEVEFMFGCHKEHLEDSCYRLGEFLETIRKKFTDAGAAFKNCCATYQNAPCCFKSGQYHLLGKGGLPKSQLEAFKCFHLACQHKIYADQGKNDRIASSCCQVGILLSQNPEKRLPILQYLESTTRDNDQKVNNDVSFTIVEAFERACTFNDRIGCNLLSQLYLGGFVKNVKANLKLAAVYAEKACDLGEPRACHNLSIMYRRGEGVDKNLEKSKAYTSKRNALVRGGLNLSFGDE